MRKLIFTFLVLTFSTIQTFASEIIAADQAEKLAESKSLYLVDIRRPEEWKQTGVARIAHPITMHNNDFLIRLDKLTGGNKSAPIALICATGQRSAWLAEQLEDNGYTNISDVSEGMMGSQAGPGWIKRGLPLASAN